jgi:nitrogen fixation/metabolism regulation signal transduction histidine kinase
LPQFSLLVNGYQHLVVEMLEAAKKSKIPEDISRTIVEINNTMPFDRYVIQSTFPAQPQRAHILETMRSKGDTLLEMAKRVSESRWKRVEEEERQIEAVKNNATFLITLTLALTLMMSFLFTWYLPRRVLHPLRQVTQALRKASHGNYDVFLHLSAKDELGELVNEFHNLIEHMRDRENSKAAPPSNGNQDQNSKLFPTFTVF